MHGVAEGSDEGDAEKLFHIGVFYGTGEVVSQDYKNRKFISKKPPQKVAPDATFQLGVYHMFGFGVDKDIHKAIDYFERAALGGHAGAAAWVAQIYERGTDGVKVNHQKAFNLYMRDAEQDNDEAMWYVIQGYLLGQGTEKNQSKAYEWFWKSGGALGYDRIKTSFGIHYFNQGDDESLDKGHYGCSRRLQRRRACGLLLYGQNDSERLLV